MAFWINFSAFQKVSFIVAIIATLLVIVDLALLIFKKEQIGISKNRFIIRVIMSFVAIWFWLALALSFPLSVLLALLLGFVLSAAVFVIMFAVLKNKIYKEYKTASEKKQDDGKFIEIENSIPHSDPILNEVSSPITATNSIETDKLSDNSKEVEKKEISSTLNKIDDEQTIETITFDDDNN